MPEDPEKQKLWIERQRESHKGQISPMKGKHHSAETRNKISESLKGEKHPMWGKHPSQKTRLKMSKAFKGRIPWNKGKTGLYRHSLETKIKISKTSKGRRVSIETRRKISEVNKNPSEVTRAKISDASKNLSQETRLKMSESHKGSKNHNWGKFGILSSGWKGGITPLHELIRQSKIYKHWRNIVFHRDKFRCQDCGKLGDGDLRGHHLFSFAKLLENFEIMSVNQAIRTKELWDINNGITLCKICHQRKKAHEENQKIKKIFSL